MHDAEPNRSRPAAVCRGTADRARPDPGLTVELQVEQAKAALGQSPDQRHDRALLEVLPATGADTGATGTDPVTNPGDLAQSRSDLIQGRRQRSVDVDEAEVGRLRRRVQLLGARPARCQPVGAYTMRRTKILHPHSLPSGCRI